MFQVPVDCLFDSLLERVPGREGEYFPGLSGISNPGRLLQFLESQSVEYAGIFCDFSGDFRDESSRISERNREFYFFQFNIQDFGRGNSQFVRRICLWIGNMKDIPAFCVFLDTELQCLNQIFYIDQTDQLPG